MAVGPESDRILNRVVDALKRVEFMGGRAVSDSASGNNLEDSRQEAKDLMWFLLRATGTVGALLIFLGVDSFSYKTRKRVEGKIFELSIDIRPPPTVDQ